MTTPSIPHSIPASKSASDDLLAGRYRLLEKIGDGGAAQVFRAVDERLNRVVAVKLLRAQFLADPDSRKRFAVEARAAANLSHANVVDVYDFGEGPDGAMFIVMRYVPGKSLRELLREKGRLSVRETVSLSRQLCAALSVAHAGGLIHRDIKPQNILVSDDGTAHLTDFGIVKALQSEEVTRTGLTFGTAGYMSPEQATGSALTPASDIYSLGCMMYEMLAGTTPFTGDTPAVVVYKQVWEQPRPLHEFASHVPASLEAVVMRCLAKDPAARYATSSDLAAALDKLDANAALQTREIPVSAERESSTPTPTGGMTAPAPVKPVQPALLPSPPARTAGATKVQSLPRAAATLPAGYARRGQPAAPPLPAPRPVTANSALRFLGLAALLVALLAAGAAGFALLPSISFPDLGSGGSATPGAGSTPSAAKPSPTSVLGQIVVDTETPEPPTASPTGTETATPTETPIPTRAPATHTPKPPPPPPPPPPTYTPEPPPQATNTPPAVTPVPDALERIVNAVIGENPDKVRDYLEGKPSALNKLLKDLADKIRQQGDTVDFEEARVLLERKLEEMRR